MKRRALILPLSAIVIAALVMWRYGRESRDEQPSPHASDARQLAPRFELYDQHSRLVKFERYLGRTAMLVLFFDDNTAPEQNQLLTRLRDDYPTFKDAGIEVIAISAATPFAIREAEERSGHEFPFPVLTDIDRHSPIPVPVHRLWGLAGDASSETRTGLFYVERDGSVASENGYPAPLPNPETFLDGLR